MILNNTTKYRYHILKYIKHQIKDYKIKLILSERSL